MGRTIVVKCKSCGKALKTSEEFLGRKGKCPGCGAPIRITEEDTEKAVAEEKQEAKVGKLETRENALIEIEMQDQVALVRFTTSRILDQSNVQQLGEEFDELLDKHKLPKIVINFDKVEYMSSAVMGKLVSLQKKVKAGKGKLILTNIARDIYEIFEIMRFDKLFKIRDTAEDALGDLR